MSAASQADAPTQGENDAPYTGDGVVKDDAPVDTIDEGTADSDAQLKADEEEAIDKSNIIGDRTRGAKPDEGYREPGDEEGLPGPGDSGTSST